MEKKTRKEKLEEETKKLNTSQKINFFINKLEKFVVPPLATKAREIAPGIRRSIRVKIDEGARMKKQALLEKETLTKEAARTTEEAKTKEALNTIEGSKIEEAVKINEGAMFGEEASIEEKKRTEGVAAVISRRKMKHSIKPKTSNIGYTVDDSVLKHWTNEEPLTYHQLQELKDQWNADNWDSLYDPPGWLTEEIFSLALTNIDSNDIKRQKFAIASENLRIARLTSSALRSKNMDSVETVRERPMHELLLELYEDYKYAMQVPLIGLLSKKKSVKPVYVMDVEVSDIGKDLANTALEILKDIQYGLLPVGDWENVNKKYFGVNLNPL